jgi:hypothetical protein
LSTLPGSKGVKEQLLAGILLQNDYQAGTAPVVSGEKITGEGRE